MPHRLEGEDHTFANIFALCMCTAGIILTVYAVKAIESLPGTCTNKYVQSGLNGILCLSVLLIVLPITQYTCQILCPNCRSVSGNLNWKIIIMGLAAALITCSSITIYGLNKNTSSCKNKSAKSFVVAVLIIAVLLMSWYIFELTPYYEELFGEVGRHHRA
jgi:hypothetical protein